MISRQYMAGFFDGEGCVNLTIRGKNRQIALRVMIVNTDPSILQEIHLQFGGTLTRPVVHRDHWKAFRALVFTGKEAFEFLASIAPYSIVKKRQIALAIDFWNFQQRPKKQRCDMFLATVHNKRSGTHPIFVRKPETIEKENWFKGQMNDLNRRGTVQ